MRSEDKKRELELTQNGVILADITAGRQENRLFLCGIRGLLVFFGAFGCIGGLASAFDLQANYALAAVSLFAISMLIAFIYFNRISFYIGYIVTLFAFGIASLYSYVYVNSGYQAFINILSERYNDHFHLRAVREAAELYSDRYVTLTAIMIFVGALLVLLLNITISGYMSLVMTFLITFLPLQLALYINLTPGFAYTAMLLAVYFSVTILGRAGIFTLPYRYPKKMSFKCISRKNRTIGYYLSSGRGMLQIALGSLVFVILFLMLFNRMLKSSADADRVESGVKAVTDEYVKTVAQGGIGSLFNRYEAKGGISHGQLGGIGNIRPDYQTDLLVRFVPYSADSIYLKTFQGVYYKENRFLPGKPGNPVSSFIDLDQYMPVLPDIDISEVKVPDTDDERLDRLKKETAVKGWNTVWKMWIGNIDADTQSDYMPYFGFFSTSDKDRIHQMIPSLFYHTADVWIGNEYEIMPARESERKEISQGILVMDENGAADYFISGVNKARLMLDTDEKMDSFTDEELKESYEVLFLPYAQASSYRQNPSVSKYYEDFVYDNYLDYPEELSGVLYDALDQAGITGEAGEYRKLYEKRKAAFTDETGALHDILTDSDVISFNDGGYIYEDYEELVRMRLDMAAKLRAYFASDFSYTMSPGRTPSGKDTVEHFLSKLKRGYCAHFASAACLILRSAGIPARYAEGYVLSYEDVFEAEKISDDTEGWKLSDQGFSEKMPLVQVELTDANAHAWIEIYLDGYGWIPYEMTPSSDESAGLQGGLGGLLGRLILETRTKSADDQSGSAGYNADEPSGKSLKTVDSDLMYTLNFIIMPLVWLALIITLSFALAPIAKRSFLKVRQRNLLRREDYTGAVFTVYRELVEKAARKGVIEKSNPQITETLDLVGAYIMKSREDKPENHQKEDALPDTAELADGILKLAYSGEKAGREECERICCDLWQLADAAFGRF